MISTGGKIKTGYSLQNKWNSLIIGIGIPLVISYIDIKYIEYFPVLFNGSELTEVIAQQDKVVNYAKKINASTDEVNRIISDFLSLSKPKQSIFEEAAVYDLLQSPRSTIETSSLFKGIYIL